MKETFRLAGGSTSNSSSSSGGGLYSQKSSTSIPRRAPPDAPSLYNTAWQASQSQSRRLASPENDDEQHENQSLGHIFPPPKRADSFGPFKPRFYTCYICEQDFGTASLMIHIKQCYRKVLATLSKLPPKERPPYPVDPTELSKEEIYARCSGCALPEKASDTNSVVSEEVEHDDDLEDAGTTENDRSSSKPRAHEFKASAAAETSGKSEESRKEPAPNVEPYDLRDESEDPIPPSPYACAAPTTLTTATNNTGPVAAPVTSAPKAVAAAAAAAAAAAPFVPPRAKAYSDGSVVILRFCDACGTRFTHGMIDAGHCLSCTEPLPPFYPGTA